LDPTGMLLATVKLHERESIVNCYQPESEVVGQFEFVLKGHGFSRAVTAAKSTAALAAGGMCLST
jgi:hypothetical protein